MAVLYRFVSFYIAEGAPTANAQVGRSSYFSRCPFATQTTFPQRDGNAVATESLEIAHEGFVGESEAVTWTAIAMAESGGSVGSYSDYSLYDLLM
jgi:hypothetical protein